jgi:hypothetical protein
LSIPIKTLPTPIDDDRIKVVMYQKDDFPQAITPGKPTYAREEENPP